MDEMSFHSEPFSASSDEEYKPESGSDSESDEYAANIDFNQTGSTESKNLTNSGVYKIVFYLL